VSMLCARAPRPVGRVSHRSSCQDPDRKRGSRHAPGLLSSQRYRKLTDARGSCEPSRGGFGRRGSRPTAVARTEDRRCPVSPEHAERAFAEFVRSYSTRLYSFALSRCGNRQLAEDILQSAFVKVWKAWPNLVDQNAVPLGYVHTTIRNLLVDHHRSVERRPESPWDDERDGRIPDSCNVAEEAVFRAMERELWAAVATLETIQQDLIHLVYSGQSSIAAASREVGLAETTARRYHDAALSRLREMIGYDTEEDQEHGR